MLGERVTPPTKESCRPLGPRWNGSSVRVRVKSGVKRAVRVQASNPVARDGNSAIGREGCKVATNQDFAVGLNDDDKHVAVGVRIETIERGLPACRRGRHQKKHQWYRRDL